MRLIKNGKLFLPDALESVNREEIIELKDDNGYSKFYKCVGKGLFEEIIDWEHSLLRQHFTKVILPIIFTEGKF